MSNTSASVLSMSPEQVDEFLAAARSEVAQEIFDSTDQGRLRQMVECMGDSRGMVRLGFADTLGRIGYPAIPFLVDGLLNHVDPVVRRASAKTLTLIAAPETVEALVQALMDDEDTVVQGSAVGALARIGKTSVPVLLEILADPEQPESRKGHAAWALAFIGTQAKEYLYKEINSDSVSVRSAVVGAIAKIAQEDEEAEAFTLLINALNDPAETVCIEAAAVLGNLAHKPAIPSLLSLLEHDGELIRKAAALSLMKIKEPHVIVPLQAALARETNADLKSIFKLAIAQIERELDD